jgi:hypothetical protein
MRLRESNQRFVALLIYGDRIWMTYVSIRRRLLASAARPWYVEPGLLAEDVRCSFTSSWWALITHVTRARLGYGRRLSGERSGDCGRPIGEEIGYRTRHYKCILDTARSDGIDFRKELGASKATETDRGQQGSAVRRGGDGMSSTLCMKRTGVGRRRHMCSKKSRP